MKKLLYTLLLFWYFGVQSPYDPEGFPNVFISTIIGPFQTELECKRERANVQMVLKSVGDTNSTITECKAVQNA